MHAFMMFMKRMLSILAMAGGWFVAAVRTMLDLIGWSTAPDDIPVFGQRIDQIMDAVFSAPWWVPWGFALVSTLWLMWVSWPRVQMSGSPEAAPTVFVSEPMEPEIAIEQRARDDLEMFVTEHLIETCAALIHLQAELVRRSGSPEKIQDMAIDGLTRRWDLRDFAEGYEMLSGFSDSPPQVPNAEELVGGVDRIEKGYPVLCEQAQQIADVVGMKFGADAQIDKIYEDWRNSHNATVEAYEKIKGDPRMRRDEILRKLHRPVRQTRFGSRIPSPQADEQIAISAP